MEFNPNNNVVRLCIKGMDMEEQNKPEAAKELFLSAWNEATNDFEKFTAAYYVARHQKSISEKLEWYKDASQFALNINSDTLNPALATLHNHIADCYEALNEPVNENEHRALANTYAGKIFDKGPFYHGTKADLQVGDMLTAGRTSNYNADITMNHIYFTAGINIATLAAALAGGDGSERVYIVEPTGEFTHDPNVTDKKFPGNPTRSYRTQAPLKIIGEATGLEKIPPDVIQNWRERLANNKGEIIN